MRMTKVWLLQQVFSSVDKIIRRRIKDNKNTVNLNLYQHLWSCFSNLIQNVGSKQYHKRWSEPWMRCYLVTGRRDAGALPSLPTSNVTLFADRFEGFIYRVTFITGNGCIYCGLSRKYLIYRKEQESAIGCHVSTISSLNVWEKVQWSWVFYLIHSFTQEGLC